METPRVAGRFELLQIVYTRGDLPELGLRRGEHGTVVEVFDGEPGSGTAARRPAYLVEFVNGDGSTRRLVELAPEQLAVAPPAV